MSAEPKTLAEKVRQIYERGPYPYGNYEALKRTAWKLNLDWVASLSPDATRPAPARVLVAGCGDGNEAFNLQRQLPAAEVCGVDFSGRSIALAKRLQRRAKDLHRIRFVQADLAEPGLARRLAARFDLISCHGVLAYIPDLEGVFRNLAQCLAPEGMLYLGVNGARHASTRLRRALPALGFDLEAFADTPHLRAVLGACDLVLRSDGLGRVAHMRTSYLATDVFGAFNQALPWEQWLRYAERAGLHYRGNTSSTRLFRHFAADERYRLLMPRSRTEVSRVLEALSPAHFHRLLFSRTPEPEPPWRGGRRLLSWRIERSRLFVYRFPPARGPVRDRLRPVTMANAALEVSMEWEMPEWEVELLRRADGRHSIASVLRRIPLTVPLTDVQNQLFFLYHLGIIRLLPPPGRA